MALAPVTNAHGVPGLEGIHSWRGFSLNNYHAVPMAVAKLRKITGLHSRPDSDDNREPLKGHSGERVLPSQTRGKTVIYEGVLQAPTLDNLRQVAAGMRSAFGTTTAEDFIHVTVPPARGGVSWYGQARVIDFTMDEEQTFPQQALPTPWQRPFTITFRMSRGYWMSDPPQADSGVGNGTVLTRFNEGNFPADPIITFSGPAALVNVERIGGPEPRKLQFAELDDLAVARVQLDFGARTMWANTGADAGNRLVMAQSNWWDDGASGMRPGQNDIRVAGVSSWELYYRHTSI